MASKTYIRINESARKQLRDKLGRYEEKLVAKVGVFGKQAAELHRKPKGPPGPHTVGDVALWHEYGIGVPERSYLRGWYEENYQTIKNDLRRTGRHVLKGKTQLREAFTSLASKYKKSVQYRMMQSIGPALSTTTVQKKGHNRSLIHTGHLLSSVSSVVEKRKKGK